MNFLSENAPVHQYVCENGGKETGLKMNNYAGSSFRPTKFLPISGLNQYINTESIFQQMKKLFEEKLIDIQKNNGKSFSIPPENCTTETSSKNTIR